MARGAPLILDPSLHYGHGRCAAGSCRSVAIHPLPITIVVAARAPAELLWPDAAWGLRCASDRPGREGLFEQVSVSECDRTVADGGHAGTYLQRPCGSRSMAGCVFVDHP